MALFVLPCVLLGLPAAAYRRTPHRKPLCGLDQYKNCSFLDWTPIVFVINHGWTRVKILIEGKENRNNSEMAGVKNFQQTRMK